MRIQREGDWVKATLTSHRILEAIVDLDGATVTEIAQEIDVSKSCVHKHLKTLEGLGYLVESEYEYNIGLKFLRYGQLARDRIDIFDVARPELNGLSTSIDERTGLFVREDDHVVCIYSTHVEDETVGFAVGQTYALATSAPGQVMLAFDGTADVEHAVETRSESAQAASLRETLRTVRDRRMAITKDVQGNVAAIAAPVLDDGDPVAAIGVSGPADRLSGKRLKEDVAGLVSTTAKNIERELRSG